MTTLSGRREWLWAVLAGAALGFVYTLSPLTVFFLAALVPLWRAASRGLSDRERNWLAALLCLAIIMRLVAVGGLFLTADAAKPFATFFGDEELFKSRTVWLRNVGLGVPISTADVVYVFDDVGHSSYVHMLAYLQALVGDAPYGVHLLNTLMYLCAVLALYRLVRPAFGGVAAMGGLALLLYLPSLMIWSMSALKEPLYALVAAVELVASVQIARAPTRWQRVLAIAVVITGAFALQSVRNGGLVVAAVGAVGGLSVGFALTRPRVLLAGLVLLPLLATVAVTRPVVQQSILRTVRMGAFNHAGHLTTPGHNYQLLDPRFYGERYDMQKLSPGEAARFAVAAMASYFTVPLPWDLASTPMLAYLPEQVVWWVTVLLVPVGLTAGLRRDPVLAALLGAHACAAIVVVAMNSGNVGTLIRHRGLALPYLAWLAALGASAMLQRLSATSSPSPGRTEAT